MSFATWIAFVIAGTVIAISPGSGAVLSMSHGLAYGVKKASATVLGLQLGLILVLVIAGAGVGTLLLASPTAFLVVKIIGALYLIYLGVSQWRSKVEAGPSASSAGLAAHPSFGKRVLTGFLTNATNPKGIIFMVAVLPQFISKDADAAAATGHPRRDHGHHRQPGDARLRDAGVVDAAPVPRSARDAHPEPLFWRGAGRRRLDAVLRQTRRRLSAAVLVSVVQHLQPSVIPVVMAWPHAV